MDEILKSIQRIIAEDERTSSPRAPVPVSATSRSYMAADEDVLELTQALNEDGSVRHLAPIGGTARPQEPVSPTISAEERVSAPEARSEVPPLRVERVEPAISPGLGSDIGVVSGGALTSGASVSTVEPEPHAVVVEPPAVPLESEAKPANAGRSLEDLVSDLLRPMLKTWLDENLPAVVERLARAEMARVTEKSGNSPG